MFARTVSGFTLASALLAIPVLLQASADAPKAEPPAIAMTAAECEVWNRERSFARSIERGDGTAFAEHVQPGAVFQAGTPAPQRGRDAVVAAWRPMITGEFPLRWHPGIVSIGGDPDIALSTGPAWVEVKHSEDADPKTAPRYRLGSFVSTWVRGDDGQWSVVFDGGGGNVPKPATQAEIEALAAARKACPYR